MAGRVASSRYEHTWGTPKDGIVTETGGRRNRNTRELDENGSGRRRGPCPGHQTFEFSGRGDRSWASGDHTPAAGGKQAAPRPLGGHG